MVEALLLASRLLLAGVFAVAGAAKLADLPGSRHALEGFGVPARLATLAGTALPLVELAIASLLIPTSTAVYGAAGGFVLLLIFLAVVAHSMVRGLKADCHCFGPLHAEAVGWRVLIRNATLAAIALFVALSPSAPGPSVVAWLVPLTALERAIVLGGGAGLVLLATQIVLLVRLVRQVERVLLPTPAPVVSDAQAEPSSTPSPRSDLSINAGPVGSQAREFELPSLEGPRVTLAALRASGKPVVLVFSDPKCGPCGALLARVGNWQREHGDLLELAVVSRGTADANRAKAVEHRLAHVLLQTDREVSRAYGVHGTPSAVLVHPDGSIGSLPVSGETEIARLVIETARHASSRTSRSAPAAVPESGARPFETEPRPAPDFTLPDLEGRAVSLTRFRGKPAMLLFWNPRCSFCRRILADVQAWDARPADERHQLLVVSVGSAEDNRALGLTSTIVLDSEHVADRQFGVLGTPSVVFVDADGQIAGGPVAGAPSVLAALDFATDAVLDSSLVPVRLDGVEDELLSDGSMVLYSERRRQVLTLNGTAALIWECCDGSHSIGAIIAEVREVFPSSGDVDRDVRQLIGRLIREGLISLRDASASNASPDAPAPLTTA